MKKTLKKPKTVYLDSKLYKVLQEQAQKEYRTINSLIVKILLEHVNKANNLS